MFKNNNLENSIIELDRKINEIEIQSEMINREVASLLTECNVTEEQISLLHASPQLFSDTNWATLQEEKKRIEEKFDHSLKNIVNPKKKAENLKTLSVKPHWLFVR